MNQPLTHLQRLEAESIHILREVVAEMRNPVLLYSVGKDSAVLLHLAAKAFYPAPPPFPFLHIASGWDFRDLINHRDNMVARYNIRLIVQTATPQESAGINPFDTPADLYAERLLIGPLKRALEQHGFDAAFGGARRDEEKSRAKERIFSFRATGQRWDPRHQRPELWRLYNTRKAKDESIRVFPLSNWTELDIWQYIEREQIPLVPLYFAATRLTVERGAMLLMVDDNRFRLLSGERPVERSIRFRTLGCYPLTGGHESNAATLNAVIAEMAASTASERQGRAIDHDQSASMEQKKQAGYF